MTKIAIMRTDQPLPQGANAEAVRDFLFGGVVVGFTEDDQKAWRRFWQRMMRAEAGELAAIEMKVPRNSRFHRKFFVLLTVGFDAWEPSRKHKTYKGMAVAKQFEQFREDVTILAGWYEQTFGLDGRMKVRAKSISFANMEQDEFELLYSAVANVLLEKVLTGYAGRDDLDAVVEKIMVFV